MSAQLPHVQYFEKALQIEPFLSYAEKVFKEPVSNPRLVILTLFLTMCVSLDILPLLFTDMMFYTHINLDIYQVVLHSVGRFIDQLGSRIKLYSEIA